MTQEELKHFEPFWDTWYIVEKLGSGSYGDVYKIKREVYGEVYYAALKVISFPQDKSESEKVFCSYGGILKRVKIHYDKMMKDMITEIRLMKRLRKKKNIVSYEEHDIIPKKNGMPGYDILIRMELLEELRIKIMKNPALVRENCHIVKIGEDIAEALKSCHSQKIVHRDIKPGNIFCSTDGTYKLGDFGSARKIFPKCQTESLEGTYDYMAPEIYRKENYDFRADIYSLGMVLYYLSNALKGPFLKIENQIPTKEEKEDALKRRMGGEPLPSPKFVSPSLAEVILKACAFHPADRFQSAEKFQAALIEVERGKEL